MTGDLFAEAALMESLADEAGIDHARAAKVMSTDTTSKSRHRGRQTRGGRLRLATVDGTAELLLEEWELQRLLRLMPEELGRLLRPSSSQRDGVTSQLLADALGPDHPAHSFFVAAARGGGFFVSRT
jgi:hypothetical protein